jgi:hypothetical protein
MRCVSTLRLCARRYVARKMPASSSKPEMDDRSTSDLCRLRSEEDAEEVMWRGFCGALLRALDTTQGLREARRRGMRVFMLAVVFNPAWGFLISEL